MHKVIAGKSVMYKVTAKDEWVAEAYMNTDYSKIDDYDFINELKKYASFKILSDKQK